ncbi:hypothetical protein BDZ94DRAFT_914598 [Collybia nuda]|uniref:Uncharacterized protein n=1 Tax=Collybia nuda TaxID=64659 RepID=A0A9P5YFF8_9AGAR|nr:hypothetical protein BDZ94DRAFT_914598 [Collybia nuda]
MASKGENDVTRYTRPSNSSENHRSSATRPSTTPTGPRKPGTATRPPAFVIQATEDRNDQIWTGKGLSDSPRSAQDELRVASPGPERRNKQSRKPTPLNIGRLIVSEEAILVPPSPSRARWEHLRQHVLPLPVRPATPPVAQPHLTPPQQTQPLPPPRSQTPKPSRLARLGFRQVVEQAREVALDDTRKFAQELQRVCWSIRYVAPERAKADREPATMGSALHLPFMSNASLTSTSSTGTDSHPGKKQELRRPQSIPALVNTYRSPPSVKLLYNILLHHATSSDGVSPSLGLPNELQVLSTLLRPFLVSERGAHIESEKLIALDSFDIIIRTWAPVDQASGLERYLWCCKAAVIPPSALRTRVVSTLWSLMIPIETNYLATTPDAFQTFAHGLFSLLPSLHPPSTDVIDQEDLALLKEMIFKLRSGCCGQFDEGSLEEEYKVALSPEDDLVIIRGAMLLQALSRCLEECTDETRLWLLQNSLQDHWITYPKGGQYTPLLAAIHSRTLNSFTRGLLSILAIPVDQSLYVSQAQHIARTLQKQVIPEIEAMGDKNVMECQSNVVKIALELICMDKARELMRWGIALIVHWYGTSPFWKSSMERAIREIVTNRDWSSILAKLLPIMKLLPEEARKPLAAFVLPLLQDKLVEVPPPYPCPPLTNFLDTIARLYPQIFFKVLFSCAASSKEFTVVNYLCIIVVVSKFLPDFWIRDAEMMSVALMSDAGGKKTGDSERPSWAKARLGQSVLLLEIIGCIQTARREKDAMAGNSEGGPSFVQTVKFALSLESRLGILLDAKEKITLIPPSQRLLLCVLFRETRLLSRSLKMAVWLPRVVSWFIDLYLEDEIGQDPEVEEKSSVGQLQGLYAAAQDGVQSSHQRRSTMLLSKNLERSHHQVEASAEGTTDLGSMFTNRTTLVISLSKGFVAKAMKLLVTVSALLTPNDYRRLGPYLWAELVSDGDNSFTSSASFLIMQCAEKTPLDFLAVMEVDLQSSDNEARLQAIRKISILSNWRFQILSQHFVADRAHRPFKLARGPLPFVATDIGSSLYINEDDPAELQDSLPLELRRRLAEIGWDQDDTPVDQHQEWLKTPMSLLPTYQLDRLENTTPDLPPSPNANAVTSSSGLKPEDIGLLRRNSSTGGPLPGVKRRMVFVPSLALIFPRLASLVFDEEVVIASGAGELIVDLMRNDPGLLTRPILDLFAGEEKDIRSAVSTINAFLHIRRTLPSPMAHYLFNNLAGFLKFASRLDDDADVLQDFAVTTTLLSKLVTQVSGMSIREIRRAKVDIFLIPSGSLWFPPSAPIGTMFPRGYEYAFNPFDGLPLHLVSITLIRVAQNLLFLSMLKRNRQDVALIRKSMSRLVLPSLKSEVDDAVLDLSDFIPKRATQTDNNKLEGLSLMLSRSHILLVAQVFRSMSRHLNDRNELAILVDGLNRILLAHGDDIGIVSQIMIALMVASTRFRRLFTSGGGYALFMPAVIKIYTEAEYHVGIKLAIEYAVNRFYALHHEAFVFQTLDIMAHIAILPNAEADWLGKGIYNLFFALRRGVLPTSPDAAGIHDSNKVEEREALIVSTVEEKPQAFLSLLRRGEPQTKGRITIDLPDEYESNRLAIDDLVRLFLTVIAHDPSIVRAEQFLRLLRLLAPYLYQASASARTVLQEGIDALGVILMRASSKPKSGDSVPIHSSNEGLSPGSPDVLLENQLLEKSRSPSDIMAMRLDYLSLIVAFTRVGGELPHPAVLRVMGLITIMLKDAPADINNMISAFFTDFIRNSLIREGPQSVKIAVATLQELAPLISAYTYAIDFTEVFEAVTTLAANPLYANNLPFSRVVVTQICVLGLGAYEVAASENLILSVPSRTSFVALLAQAVLLRGVDIIPELEKRTSYRFLVGIILPLTMSLKTESDLISANARSEPWHRDALASTWVRLLSHSMSVCQKIIGKTSERSKGYDKGRSSTSKQAELPAFIVALQIIKTIVIRAQADLSSRIPGIWARIAAFLKTILTEGSANFASRAQDISPISTPTGSPRASGQFDHQFPSSLTISTNVPNPSLGGQAFSSPRIVDYALWSLLELLCVHRNPLFLQLRLFTVEKLVELDNELQHHHNPHSPVTPRSRPVSSAFSKPRRRASGLPSPNSSPRLGPSQSFPHDASLLSIDGRQAGYNNAASPQNTHGPRIVHLGPISATSMFGRGLSLGRGRGTDNPTTTTKIKSLTLVRATYKRIRTVQTCMGYETLLPMPNNHEMDADEETKDLMEEFEESDRSLEDEGVMVESFQSMT